jgi:hypothetical protein
MTLVSCLELLVSDYLLRMGGRCLGKGLLSLSFYTPGYLTRNMNIGREKRPENVF